MGSETERTEERAALARRARTHAWCGGRWQGIAMLDYAGRISVVVGEDPDTNRSSYLLNLFKDEDAG